jgi:hypothetical protein
MRYAGVSNVLGPDMICDPLDGTRLLMHYAPETPVPMPKHERRSDDIVRVVPLVQPPKAFPPLTRRTRATAGGYFARCADD